MSDLRRAARPRPPYVPASPLEHLERRALLSGGAPQVLSAEFEFERGHAFVIRFDQNVGASLDREDFALMNVNSGEVIAGVDIDIAFRDSDNVATFTFPKYADKLLPDGNYRVFLYGSGVHGPGGTPMPEPEYAFKFRFLRGDANGDGVVNLRDFNVLASNFGKSGATFSQGDFDYDGRIDLQDFTLLAGRFGTSIV